MFSYPFLILIEKVPFLEYLIRAFSFFRKPDVETVGEFHSGKMKYALWDIICVISIFTISTGLINLFTQNDLDQSMKFFGNQFVLYFQFGYHAFFSTLMFFFIVYTCLACSKRSFKVLAQSFLCAMQYARFYALFLFLFFPLVAWSANLLVSELTTIEEFIGNNILISFIAFLSYVIVYFRCCVSPLARFTLLFSNELGTKVAIVCITLISFSLNTVAPELGKLEFQAKDACNTMYKSEKFMNLSAKNQELFKVQCESKHNQKHQRTP